MNGQSVSAEPTSAATPWSSWDLVRWFCHELATMSGTADVHHHVRGMGAHCFLWLSALQVARTGQLLARWRLTLPMPDETPSVAIATAAMDLAAQPPQLWEPFVAGVGGRQAAANSWYQATSVMLFDAIFLARDAVAQGWVPDDEWHRHTLPMALQQAALTAQAAFNTVVRPEHEDGVWSSAAWSADGSLVTAPVPWYWDCDEPKPIKYNLDPEALRAAQARFGTG